MNNKPIYMASSLNNWNPGDENFMLKKQSENKYYIILPDSLQKFEYKFTQGNWNTVEADEQHNLLPNRVYIKQQEVNQKLVKVAITGWEKRHIYMLHLITVPKNTPHDAEIYVAGNFNDWKESDPTYKLERQFDGTFKVNIHSDIDEIAFKFNRGTWQAVESWKNGKARPNRTLLFENTEINKPVKFEVDNWEDLTATFNYFSVIDLLLLFAAFQGLLLSIVIPTMQDFNREANRWLVILLGIGSVLMMLRVVGNFRDVANMLPKLLLIPNLILFLYAPLFYLFLQQLLFKKTIRLQEYWPNLVPFFIQLLILLPYFFMDAKRFQHKVVNEELDLKIIYAILSSIAVVYNTYYIRLYRRSIKVYQDQYMNETSFHQNISYLSIAVVIHMICIVLGAFTGCMYAIQYFWNQNIAEITENSINLIWFIFSLVSYVLGYFAIHQPEIFKIAPELLTQEPAAVPDANPIVLDVPQSQTKQKGNMNPVFDDSIERYKESLLASIQGKKLYLNPNLTLNDLATSMKIPAHSLSKIINDGFGKNFFDFVNYYRIEEFKERVNDNRYQHYTLLGIAFDVGFNSKTAFNRSFKKIMNQTPSEFYHSRKE
jgi:AraC-like DNA-binding protein